MRRAEIPESLLMDVKNHLNITWNEPALDEKIQGLVASATRYLDLKAGEELDYEMDGLPRLLLMECVRYLRDEAMDVFENNYQSLILAMQDERRVTIHEEATVSDKT